MSLGNSWVIGLTGGIGTGKTCVANLLRRLGAAVECADEIVHELQAPGGRALERIAETFGAEYLDPAGALDRARLGELVFRDASARQRLNQIIHPMVLEELRARLQADAEAGYEVIVLDIPLLIEGRLAGRGAGATLPFDHIVLVYAPRELQLERVAARDGLEPDAVENRLRSQLGIDEKCEHADVIIDNSGPWEKTEQTVRELYADWLRERP